MIDKIKYQHYKYFSEISKYAKEHECYDLSLGITDTDVDPKLKFLLQKSAQDFHNYETLQGSYKLIKSIIEFNKRRSNPIQLNFDEVNIIPCSTFGLYTALKSIVKPDDEVIVFEPCYYTYNPIIELNLAQPIRCLLQADYSVDFNLLENLISEKTKAIIINTPHNPSGRIFTYEDWNNLYNLIKDKNIYLLCEEIYDHYVYDKQNHISPLQHFGLRERTFSIFSFGKMFHITGWKISYMVANSKLLENFREYQQYISYGVNAAGQHAIAEYLQDYSPQSSCLQMQEKRDMTIDYLKNSPFEIVAPAQGAFYQIIDFYEVNKTLNDKDFAEHLLKNKSIALLPLSAFYTEPTITTRLRLSFSRSHENLERALDHLVKSV